MSEKKLFAQELHKRAIKKFQRRHVIVDRKDEIWAMDLASLDSLVSYNDGYKYILCIIDVFSKYAWAVALKNKTAATVLSAVQDVIKKSKRWPETIWVDQGSEFYNKVFQAWLKSNDIVLYSTHGESKSVVVERFIKSLKDIMTSYFTEHSTRNWVNILDDLLEFYNNRVHKTIKMTPKEASKKENELQVKSAFYHAPTKRKGPKFSVGDKVRISRTKDTFEKGYEHNFSYEVFTVSEVLKTDPVTYKLKDYHGELLSGSFYEQEMLKTNVPDYYEIEKILKMKKSGKKKYYLVKFLGWPSKFNDWLPENQIYDL